MSRFMRLALKTGMLDGNPNRATIGVTTTGAETLTIAALTVATGQTAVVQWGDGLSDTYTGAGARTHNYAAEGVYSVILTPASAITVLTLSDDKMTVNSVSLRAMVNMVTFQANSVKGGTFNSSDVSAWRPTTFYLYSIDRKSVV